MLYNIDYRKALSRVTIGIIFAALGFVFIAIFCYSYIEEAEIKYDSVTIVKENNIEERYDEIENDTTYIYYYYVDNVKYACYSSIPPQNGSSTIYYSSDNPSFCTLYIQTVSDNESSDLLGITLFFPGIFCFIGIIDIIRALYKYTVAKRLARCGILVKGLPYSLIESGIKVNNESLMCLCTVYTFPNGDVKELKSEPLPSKLLNYRDGICDLLFDPNNYNNYFLDYEITTTGIGNPQVIYASDDEISKYGREYTSIR